MVAERSVLVCAGAGGVGKTSVAAALAVQAATLGRRAVVVTIDPARRLADALGLDGLTNDPHRVAGPWPGELHAAMLDTRATFDALVARYAASETQTAEILQNRFYRNISHALSGTQEYMAAEKLYELHVADRFDLVVVDTPPTRQALDFLDAPGQLKRFLDHRVYRLMTSGKRGMTGVLNRAGFAVLRTAGRLVGAPVMEDAIAFFTAFEGMEAGFRQRAQQVHSVLRSPATAFVVLTGPQLDTVTEAAFFLRRLRAEGLETAAVVANRVTPRFVEDEATLARLRELAGGPDRPPGEGEGEAEGGAGAAAGLAALAAAVLDQHDLADDEDAILAQLSIAPSARVPLLDHDIHDLDGLDDLRRLLFEV
ncbi:MAG: ArsA family ATPase [Acidimicrobiales bacterium]|nr:ArsA family ATPase [Acidimicrobiales bacterium]